MERFPIGLVLGGLGPHAPRIPRTPPVPGPPVGPARSSRPARRRADGSRIESSLTDQQRIGLRRADRPCLPTAAPGDGRSGSFGVTTPRRRWGGESIACWPKSSSWGTSLSSVACRGRGGAGQAAAGAARRCAACGTAIDSDESRMATAERGGRSRSARLWQRVSPKC